MKKKILLNVLSLWLFIFSTAQDIHFSQYFSSPMNLSASELGNFESDYRAVLNYRNQWSAVGDAYETIAMGVERQFYWFNQKFSGGLYFANDKSGGIDLQVNQMYFGVAYHSVISYHQLHIGAQFGWVFKSFDKSKVTLLEQFDNTNGYFNSNLSNHEAYYENANYPDLNFGASWSRKLYHFEPFAGVALHHVLKPKETFYENNNSLHQRLTLYGGVINNFTDRIDIIPIFKLMIYSSAKEYIAGVNVIYKFREPFFTIKKALFGAHFRDPVNFKSDALIPVLGVYLKYFYAGVSYDVNVSKYKSATNRRGAIEFSLIYLGLKTKSNQRTFPCDRY
ncbi:MAG: PorP/SprF family type IX secretion system membrane protein [Bacteroidales bacterium]|nr:PorP/SprF family type IX secretion system membrane protein [Bacteroidales bacterium]